MKITYYLYNTFLIEAGDKKLVIDPGAGLYLLRFKSILPKSEWESITHVFITHGDPDHHWNTDRVAAASGAPVICNRTMVEEQNGTQRMLGPRSRGLAFTTMLPDVRIVSVGEIISFDGMSVTGIKTTHGPINMNIGPIPYTLEPGPKERIGFGSIGFEIELAGVKLVNLGDTLFHETEWRDLRNPDVLMIPIGGKVPGNTMDENEALRAVRDMSPRLVIPCHYDCASVFRKAFNPADTDMFKREVEKIGIKCAVLGFGESVTIS